MGVAVALIEEKATTTSAAEVGHDAFNGALESGINEIIPELTEEQPEPSGPSRVEKLKETGAPATRSKER